MGGERKGNSSLRGRDSLGFNCSFASVQTLAQVSVIMQTGLDTHECARRRWNACGNRSVSQILLRALFNTSADKYNWTEHSLDLIPPAVLRKCLATMPTGQELSLETLISSFAALACIIMKCSRSQRPSPTIVRSLASEHSQCSISTSFQVILTSFASFAVAQRSMTQTHSPSSFSRRL